MRRWLLLVCIASACATPLGTDDYAVTNGTEDSGDPAVVALVDSGTGVLCTASVIGPHTGITAAHCFGGPPARSLRLFFGSTLAGGGTFVTVSDARQHPAFDPVTFAHDVALFTFREDPPVAPLSLDTRTIDSSLVGTTFSAVGFGTIDASVGVGVKRIGTARISGVQPDELTAMPDPAQPCRGDSGGPMLIAPAAVAAVVSHGDAACTDHAIYARIDVARATLVDPYIADTAPGTAHTGDTCFYEGHCAEGPCLQAADDPLLYFCSRTCMHDSDCPAAMDCAAGSCRYPEPSPGALGSACTADAQCTSRTCRDEVCTVSCLGSPEACPADYECRGAGLDQYCFAAPTGCSGCAGGAGAPAWFVVLWLGWIYRRRARAR